MRRIFGTAAIIGICSLLCWGCGGGGGGNQSTTPTSGPIQNPLPNPNPVPIPPPESSPETYKTPYPYIDVLHSSIAFDEKRRLLYAYVPPGDARHPKTFAVIDVDNLTVKYSSPVDFVPLTLSVSPDSRYLYVGTVDTEEVIRLSLPDMAEDLRLDPGFNESAPPWVPQHMGPSHIAAFPDDSQTFIVSMVDTSLTNCASAMRIYHNTSMVAQMYDSVDTFMGSVISYDVNTGLWVTACSGGYPDIVTRLAFDGSALRIVDTQRGISGGGAMVQVRNDAILTGAGNVFDLPSLDLRGGLPPLTPYLLIDPSTLIYGCVFADETSRSAACLSQTDPADGYPTFRAFVLYELTNANPYLIIPLDLGMSSKVSQIIRIGEGSFAVSVGPSMDNLYMISQYQYLKQNTRIYFLNGINTNFQ